MVISFVAKEKKEPREIIDWETFTRRQRRGLEAKVRIGGKTIKRFSRRKKGAKRTVDVDVVVAEDLLDLTLLLEISKSLAGQATVDLQTVDKGGDSDETVGLDILVEPLGGRLLKDDGVLGLVLNYNSHETSAFRSLFSSDQLLKSFFIISHPDSEKFFLSPSLSFLSSSIIVLDIADGSGMRRG